MVATRTPPGLPTLVALTGLSVLALNMFLPSLANIAEDLGADYATISLAIGGYLAVTGLVLLIAGPMSDRIGRRPVILGALAIFAAASVGCALAETPGTFLAFRMLQAGMAAGQALALAIVRDTRPPGEAASVIGYISMAMALGPMLGPVIGGALDAGFGWRATFWLYAAGSLALFVLSCVDLGETRVARPSGTPERSAALLREPLFWAYSLCSMFSVGAFYIFLTGAPLVASSTFGVGAAELGLYIGSITAGFMLGGFVSGRFATRTPASVLIGAGRTLAVAGLGAGLLLALAGIVTPLTFFGSTIFVGIGNGLTLPSANALAMSVRPGLVGTAAGWNAALGVFGGAVLTTATGHALPEAGGGPVLLGLMLTSALSALAAALWARSLEAGRHVGTA